MKITDFAKDVAVIECGKKQVNIAQIKEVMRCINHLLFGELYKLIRKLG